MDFNQANDYTNKLLNTKWVKWIHEGSVPAKSNKLKALNDLLGTISKHCPKCLNLNGCCFVREKCPTIPIHPNYHCEIIDIEGIDPTANCAVEKFTNYIFDILKSKGKKQLFELWGYDILDSNYLQKELELQARTAYMVGNYSLGKIDGFGQRVKIRIKIENKRNGGYVEFNSGWMIYPDGMLILTTPYGDK